MTMKEQVCSNRVTIEIAFQPLHPATDASPHNEHATAVRKEPDLHLNFYQRDVTKGMK